MGEYAKTHKRQARFQRRAVGNTLQDVDGYALRHHSNRTGRSAANDARNVTEHREGEDGEEKRQQCENGGAEVLPRFFRVDRQLVAEEVPEEEDGLQTVEEGVYEEEDEELHRADAHAVVDPPTV